MTRSSRARWLPALILIASFLPRSAAAECVIGSSVRVRAEPRPDAEVVGTLPIESQVEVRQQQDGWAFVSEYEGLAPWAKPSGSPPGWVRAELVAASCLSFEEAMASAAGAADAAGRRSALERAAALAHSRPELVRALEALARVLDELGDPRKEDVRAELADLRDPARLSKGRRGRELALLVSGEPSGQVAPLGFLGGNVETLAWGSQWEGTHFMARHLYPGRTFELLGDGGGGTATIAEDPAFTVRQYDCNQSMTATARVRRAPGEKGRAWIAVPAHGGPRARGRPLSEPERRAAVALGRRAFEAAHHWDVDAAVVERAARSGKAAGFARDVDGDGAAELVAVVEFHAPKKALDGYVLLVARKQAGGAYVPFLQSALVGIRDEQTQVGLELVGAADLTGDGIDELVVRVESYEYEAVQVLVLENGTYRAVTVAGGGC